jgi:hypothetical protein
LSRAATIFRWISAIAFAHSSGARPVLTGE